MCVCRCCCWQVRIWNGTDEEKAFVCVCVLNDKMPSQLLLNINLPIKLPEMITPTLASRHGFCCRTPKYFAFAFMFGPFKMRWNETFSLLPHSFQRSDTLARLLRPRYAFFTSKMPPNAERYRIVFNAICQKCVFGGIRAQKLWLSIKIRPHSITITNFQNFQM